MVDPLVSVIIPVYNPGKYFKYCLDALFSQSLDRIELLFINDHGTDNSWDYLRNYLEGEKEQHVVSVKLIEHSENRGAAAARNTGIQHALGAYVTFCDADDWMSSNTLEQLYLKAEEQQSDIVWSDFYYSYETYELISKESIPTNSKSCIKALLSEEMHGSLCNKLYKRDLFILNDIQFDEKASVWEDLYANIRLFYFAKHVTYISEAFYHYRQEIPTSLTGIENHRRVSDVQINCDNIVRFLSNKGYDRELNFLKLASKKLLLNELDLESFKKWTTIYPESNQYVLAYKKLPIHLRMVAYSSYKKLWLVVQVWIVLKKIKNR